MVVKENINVRIGREISANFDVNISARADMAGRVSCFIIILEERSETIHLNVAGHGEIEIAAVVDLPICVLNYRLKIARFGEPRRRAKAGCGEITADVYSNFPPVSICAPSLLQKKRIQ